MSTLANTSWVITIAYGSVMNLKFRADGTVVLWLTDGGQEQGSWAESADGQFMFQLPEATTNPKIHEVFFGQYKDGMARGHKCGTTRLLTTFTMTRSPNRTVGMGSRYAMWGASVLSFLGLSKLF
jgi:hypothetical protein